MSLKSVHVFRWNKLLLIPLLLAGLLVWLLLPQKNIEAAWFDDSWLYRTAYNLTNSGAAVNAERKIKLDIDTATLITAGKLQSDCDDARFTDVNGDPLEYFIDTDSGACNTSSTDFYIKVPQVIAGKQTIYYYYGNSAAARGRANDFFAPDSTGQALKAYYKMDEAAANTCTGGANDTCDYALTNDGAWNGDVASVAGKVGNGTTYDGTGDYINMGVTNNLNYPLTLSAWVKRASGGSTYHDIISHGTNGFNLSFYPDNTVAFGKQGIQLITNTTATITVDGIWHHILVTYDGANGSIYIDGSLSRTQSSSLAFTGSTALGVGNDPVNDEYLSGQIDDVRIYSRALTAPEITAIYNSGNGQSINVPLTFTQSATAAATEEKGPGPVAAWNFDEGTGVVAFDATPQGNNGTLTNGPVWKNESDCISGKCLQFDGTNDHVTAGDIDKLDAMTAFTISAWVKTSSLTGGAANTRYIIAKEGNNSASTSFILRLNTSTAAIDFYVGGSTYYTVSTNALSANQWYYVTAMYNGSTANIYVNGQLISSTAASGTTGTNSNAVTIGTYTGDTARDWHGFIDEVRIYPYARTAAQIKSDFAARGSVQGAAAQFGAGGAGSGEKLSNGLVAYYPMDESAANSCTGGTNDTCDKSGNGNDGAWNGNATIATGKYGNGTTYDGAGDYTGISNTTSLQTPTNNSWSMSAWINPTSLGGTHTIIRKGFSADGYFLRIEGTTLRSLFATSTSSVSLTSGTIQTSTWQHVMAIYDGQKVSHYINGTFISSTTNAQTLSFSNASIFTGALGGSGEEFSGSLDETRIYNRALSPAEVRALYTWAPGPVAHWKLDENTGTSATDNSGNSNTGTLTNGPTWTQGKFGSAVKFDGTNDRIDTGNTVASAKNGAISFWYKESVTNNEGTLISNENTGSYSDGTFIISPRSNPAIEILGYYNGGWDMSLSFSQTRDTNWHHLSVTWDATSLSAKVYLDGTLKNSDTITSGFSLFNSSNINIGSRLGASFFENGLIDDVRIYNYALTGRQITNVMNGRDVNDPAVGSPVGHPVLHLSFDEGYGTTAQDQSINNNDGTLTNMASPATATSGWSNSGKFGKALAFDGGNDYVNAGDINAVDGQTAMTYSAWIYRTGATLFDGIVSKGSDYNNSILDLLLAGSIAGTDDLFARVSNASSNSYGYTTGNYITTNRWYHVAMVFDGNGATNTDRLKVYIDGSNKPLTFSGTIPSSTPSNSDGLYIGRYAVNDHFFSGLIDEVKIYNYALTEDDIRLEYNAGQAVVFGAKSTASDGITADNSSSREYCVPGDTSTCNAPVGEWNMDENTGTTAYDTSGTGNTGTLTNSPTWVSGKFGSALNFNGTTAYVNAGSGSSVDDISPLTTSAWIYPRTEGENSRGAIVTKINGIQDGWMFRIASGGTNTLEFEVDYTTTNLIRVASNSILTLNTWQHVALTWDGSTTASNVHIYVNGVEVTYATTTNGSGSRVTDAAQNLYIGENTSLANAFNGLIDHVRIYNYARTAAQIAWEYNRGAPVAWYKLDECQGTTAYNSAKNGNGQAAGNNGTLTIGATGSNTSAGTCTGSVGEAWKDGATGKINSSLEFDGSDDYASMADASTLDVASDMTISAWVKLNSSPANDVIVGKYGSAGQRSYMLYVANTNQVNMLISADGTNSEQTGVGTIDISTGIWYHITGVYAAGSSIKTYINGNLSKSNTTSIPSSIFNSTTALEVGRATGYTNYLDGQIDDVRIYNYALTPAQIRDVFNNGAVSFK